MFNVMYSADKSICWQARENTKGHKNKYYFFTSAILKSYLLYFALWFFDVRTYYPHISIRVESDTKTILPNEKLLAM